jgi:8-oxo-dGTP pyrophosphatase MutT (NUDIX family)
LAPVAEAASEASAIHPAATVLLLRDAALGLQVLLMQRATQLAFHGGAWAFPGGRVEACDGPEGDVLAAARRAAVRETQEEARLVIAADELACFSHWTTPPGRTRRFATWFFAARVGAEEQVVVDGVEMSAHRWLTPREALAAHARGALELPPPTFVSLSVLAGWMAAGVVSAPEVLARARAQEPPRFVPRLRAGPPHEVILYQGDAAYDGAPLDSAGARHRLLRLSDGYRYENTT